MIESEAQARSWIEKLPEIDSLTITRLEQFEVLLREANARQNLVSSKSLDHVWVRHYVDSLQLLDDVPRGTCAWLDLGTGAGFPGLAIALARPDIRVVCVESRALRAGYLRKVIDELALQNCQIVGARLQDVVDEKFDAISARAFAPLPKLLDLSARFSTLETMWRLPKGRSAAQELAELRGWEHLFHVEQSITNPEAGVICGHLVGRDKGNWM